MVIYFLDLPQVQGNKIAIVYLLLTLVYSGDKMPCTEDLIIALP